MAYFYRGFFTGWTASRTTRERASEAQNSRTAMPRSTSTRAIGAAGLPRRFSHHKAGGDGSDALKRAQANARNIKLPPYNLKANVLFIVEFGPGPVKYDRPICRRTPVSHPACEHPFRSHHNHRHELPGAPCDDLNFQATTRGGRMMDHILATKPCFKSARTSLATLPSSVARFWRASRIGTARWMKLAWACCCRRGQQDRFRSHYAAGGRALVDNLPNSSVSPMSRFQRTTHGHGRIP